MSQSIEELQAARARIVAEHGEAVRRAAEIKAVIAEHEASLGRINCAIKEANTDAHNRRMEVKEYATQERFAILVNSMLTWKDDLAKIEKSPITPQAEKLFSRRAIARLEAIISSATTLGN